MAKIELKSRVLHQAYFLRGGKSELDHLIVPVIVRNRVTFSKLVAVHCESPAAVVNRDGAVLYDVRHNGRVMRWRIWRAAALGDTRLELPATDNLDVVRITAAEFPIVVAWATAINTGLAAGISPF